MRTVVRVLVVVSCLALIPLQAWAEPSLTGVEIESTEPEVRVVVVFDEPFGFRKKFDGFLSVFFVLAGFRLELVTLTSVGLLGIVYVLARCVGLILGGRLGAGIARAAPEPRAMGRCLRPCSQFRRRGPRGARSHRRGPRYARARD